MRIRIAVAWAIATAAALALASSAQAGSITVTHTTADSNLGTPANLTNGICTLREAVREANSDLDGTSPDCDFSPDASGLDTIILPAGTYTLSGGPSATNETGDLDVIDPDGLNIVRPAGQTSITMIQATSGLDNVINHLAGTLTLDGVGVEGGSTSLNGGGIQSFADLSINNSLIRLNTSTGSGTQQGGGVYMDSGTLYAENTTFTGNTAVSSGTASLGGAIGFDAGTGGQVVDSSFISNSAANTNASPDTGTAQGGAIASPSATTTGASDVDISGSLFDANNATGLLGNQHEADGGAIYWNDGNDATTAELKVDNSTFNSNSVSGTTFSFDYGGAIYSRQGITKLAHITFANNSTDAATANQGDAIYSYATTAAHTITFRGSIFQDGTGADECYRAGPAPGFVSAGYNVDRGTTCGPTASGDIQNAAAGSMSLGSNGGLTRTRAIPAGSQAIDRDTACLDTAGVVEDDDQRAGPRGLAGTDDGTACDSGAYELITCGPSNLPVTVFGTTGGDILLTGTSSNDVINAFGGSDTIYGGNGNDTICGGDGSDAIHGQGGDDQMYGGAGTNGLYYSSSPTGVQVDMAAGTATGEGSDTFDTSFVQVTGSPQADTIAGDGNLNLLFGENGNDTIEGRGGSDTLNGGGSGDPDDRVVYDEAPGGVTVSLGPGTATGDGTDSLLFFENVTGSAADDVFVGTASDNDFAGGGGSDTVSYAGGNAIVANLPAGTVTGQGNDTVDSIEGLLGTSFADTLTGDGAANTLNSGAGQDIVTGGAGADSINTGADADDVFVRDSQADNVACGTEADDVEADTAPTDFLTDCENVSFPPVVTPPDPPVQTPKAKCPKGKKLKKVKGKKKCVKAKKRK